MSKEASKNYFEHYAKVAETNIKSLSHIKTFQDCQTRKEFSEYMLNVFIAYYGLRCTCDDCQDWEFRAASGHYNRCELWKFCHLIDRCLDWAEKHPKQSQEEQKLA